MRLTGHKTHLRFIPPPKELFGACAVHVDSLPAVAL